MAKDDQPGAHFDTNPEDPSGPGFARPETEPPKDDPADSLGTEQQLEKAQVNLLNEQLNYLKTSQEREAREEAQFAPMYQSALRAMAQPLPQPPSMTEPSPYGQTPPDPQSQRSGVLGGIMYGLLGLGLAKIFAGKNKYAYYGAINGLGEALQQRNANQEKASEESFNRWLKMNELWHQQLRDRYDDYRTAMENRKFTEQQRLDMIDLISKQHGNIQTAAAARSGQIEKVAQQIEHLGKMVQSRAVQAWKIQEAWLKRQGNDVEARAYRSMMHHDYGIDMDVPEQAARADEIYPLSEFHQSWVQEHKTKPGEPVPPLGKRPSTETNPLGLDLPNPEKPAAPSEGTTGEY